METMPECFLGVRWAGQWRSAGTLRPPWNIRHFTWDVQHFTNTTCFNRVILILDLVSPECSTCSQIIANTHTIPKTPDLDRWVEF